MKRLLVLVIAGLVLVPATSRAQLGELDHLLCYRMRDPLSLEAKFNLLARLQPEFSRRGCTLVPDDHGVANTQFCVPASKRDVEASSHNPEFGGPTLSADYICYRVDCERTNARIPAKEVEDQFGRRVARFGNPVRVCVPARKEAVACGPTGPSTAPMCGGECPSPEQRCVFNRDTDMCECAARECRRPDGAAMCAGECPNPNDRCVQTNRNQCECRPGGCAVDPTTNQCGGQCPNASQICTIDAAGNCGCQPPPPGCARDPMTEQCGGPCPEAGDVCTLHPNGQCRCRRPPPPECGQNDAGECSGSCPPGRDCRPTDDDTCRCLPPPSQCAAVNGMCGGPCPVAGQVCGTDDAGNCRCLPPPSQCSVDASGACGGPCPDGLQCTAVGGACTCVSACGFDPMAAECAGACPPGAVCRPQPGTDQCVCANPNGLMLGHRNKKN
jgi:hypothetical protein